MNAPSNKQQDCDNSASSLLSVNEAKQRILDNVSTISGKETVAIRSALGRILAQDILSTSNVPNYDNSAMDGYAVHGEDLPGDGTVTLQLIGESFAGHPFSGSAGRGQAVRIMTGAMMPDGLDTVIMQEQVTVQTEDKISMGAGHQRGENVRYTGEDMAIGQTVLASGKRIGPAELGLMASLGLPEVRVIRPLRVAFFSTGDELRGVGEALAEGQIYDSNRYTLYGMLKQLGVELVDMGVIADDRDAVRTAFSTAADIADVILTSGGVSVGAADYVKQTLEELGQVNFWRVAMKPGKPLAIGTIGKAAFFGLPGNPVSAMATFYQFVLPALEKMMGMSARQRLSLKVPCQSALKKQPGRLEYQRGVLQYDDQGELFVTTTGVQGSHILTSMSLANCFIILPADNAGISAGDSVEVEPFSDFSPT